MILLAFTQVTECFSMKSSRLMESEQDDVCKGDISLTFSTSSFSHLIQLLSQLKYIPTISLIRFSPPIWQVE